MNRMLISALLVNGSVLSGMVGCSSAGGPGWRVEANQRIEAIRKGDFEVFVTDASGQPVADTPIRFQQVRPHFLFGTAVAGNPKRDTPNEKQFRQWITDRLNSIVHENYLKWYTVEKQRGVADYDMADAYIDWAEANGLKVRGHCLVWAREKWVHDWLLAVAAEEGAEALRAELNDHIDRTVKRYRGRLIAWDVANEILDGGWFEDQLGPGAHAAMFRRAHAADPDTPLFVNEFDILGNEEKTERYIALIRELQAQGAPIAGIGIQEHSAQRFDTGYVRSPKPDADTIDETPQFRRDKPQAIYDTLTRLHEATGLPIHLTEISSRTNDPLERAEGIEAVFRVGYSHPAVECIMLWGFWQKRHFAGKKAALVDGDWRPTAAGERFDQMLLNEWRTDITVTTDARGRATFRGFFGEYQVTSIGDESAGNARVSLTPSDLEAEVSIDGH